MKIKKGPLVINPPCGFCKKKNGFRFGLEHKQKHYELCESCMSRVVRAKEAVLRQRQAGPVPLQTLKDAERDVIGLHLARHKGNIVHTARALNITRSTLYSKIKELGIERE